MVLNATDAPKMFEQPDAYKKLVDHQIDAMRGQYEKQLAEQRKVQLLGSSSTDITGNQIFDVVSEMMSCVPSEDGQLILVSAKLPATQKGASNNYLRSYPDFLADANEAVKVQLQAQQGRQQLELARQNLEAIMQEKEKS